MKNILLKLLLLLICALFVLPILSANEGHLEEISAIGYIKIGTTGDYKYWCLSKKRRFKAYIS